MASGSHITRKRDRRSRKYKILHDALERECRKPEPTRQQRHKAASQAVRQCGAP